MRLNCLWQETDVRGGNGDKGEQKNNKDYIEGSS